MTRLYRNILIGLVLLLVSLQAGDRVAVWLIEIIFGFLYFLFFEYLHHRFVLHSSHDYFGTSHAQHHRTFRGEHVQVDVANSEEINEPSHIFPLAFLSHWAVIDILFASVPGLFMATLCALYVWYEIGHWACHVKGNIVDEFLLNLPYIRDVRQRQIAHHIDHHTHPKFNYNFTWPFLGDLTQDTLEKP